MKIIKKFLVIFILFVITFYLYSNFVANEFFHSPFSLDNIDSSSYKKGVPVSFKSGNYLLKGNLLTPTIAGKKIPVIIFCVGSAISSYASNYIKFLNSLFEKNLPKSNIKN